MSLDLTVNNKLSSTAQSIQDQDGNKSTIAISTSKVGIGTTTPTAQLSIKANSSYPNEAINLQNSSSGSSIISIMQGTNGHGNFFLNRVDGKNSVKLAGGGNSYVNVDTNGGNFGVGTNSPTTMLDVNGEVKCLKLTVTNGDAFAIMNVPEASTAPNQSRLEGLLIDPTTGMLYYQ